jgi:hypothetical protein
MEIWEKKYIVRLIDQIKNKKFLIELYKIILKENIIHTRNNNGVFINLNAIENDKLEIIKNYLYTINI